MLFEWIMATNTKGTRTKLSQNVLQRKWVSATTRSFIDKQNATEHNNKNNTTYYGLVRTTLFFVHFLARILLVWQEFCEWK